MMSNLILEMRVLIAQKMYLKRSFRESLQYQTQQQTYPPSASQ